MVVDSLEGTPDMSFDGLMVGGALELIFGRRREARVIIICTIAAD